MFAVGDLYSRSTITELLDVTTWQWTVKASYPFETRITRARTLYHNGHFFTFGGYGYDHLSRIASYSPSTNTWTYRGRLRTPRNGAGVIWSHDAFIVMGGWMDGKQSSEKCRFIGDRIKCEYQSPTQHYRK